MDIQKIIKQLIYNNILLSKPINYERLNGGTTSEVYLLINDDFKYVIKKNESQVIKSEAIFLDYYKESNLLPKPVFIEQSYKYIVYSYLNGSTNYVGSNKKEFLESLVKRLLNKYKTVSKNVGWGWVDDPVASWQKFLINEIIETNKIVHSHLDNSYCNFVLELVEKINNDRSPFLLHGDCGVHNFIFENRRLSGVIDPTPIIGEPLYDLLYAFCSSPNDLTKETIDSAVNHLVNKEENSYATLYEEVLISLYLRFGASIKHHPHDFQKYLKAWHYWIDIIKRET